jgi:hypothetical protein
MNSITIALSDERLQKLQQLAADLNVSIEDLILMGLENLIAQQAKIPPHTANEILAKNAGIDPSVVDKFYILASQWQNEVAGMSSTIQMSQHPAYREIIDMGHQIVPLLLLELKANPLYWLTALNQITAENPVQPEQRGRIKQMASAWIEWGKNRGYAIADNV